jgi:hypothetical protein
LAPRSFIDLTVRAVREPRLWLRGDGASVTGARVATLAWRSRHEVIADIPDGSVQFVGARTSG